MKAVEGELKSVSCICWATGGEMWRKFYISHRNWHENNQLGAGYRT